MKRTPTSVMVLGIIGIVIGVFTLIGLACMGITPFLGTPTDPLNQALREDTANKIVMVITVAIGIPMVVLLFAASIGSLRLSHWARKAMLVWAWLTVAEAVLRAIYNFVHLVPLMMRSVPADAPQPLQMIGKMAPVSTGCGAILTFIFPVLVLVFYSRPKVIDAFAGRLPDPLADGIPQDPLPPQQFP